MKYLENAIKFMIKYWILAVPLFICVAIPALITHTTTSLAQFAGILSSLKDPSQLSNPAAIISTLPAVFGAVAGGGIFAFLFQFISMPATYGMVNKGLETGNAGINDVGQAVSQNFVKYVMYFIGMIVLSIVSIIAFLIISLILGLLVSILKGVGVLIMILVMLALVIALIVALILLSMWLSAMVVDNLDVIAAARKSMEIVKSCFWTIVGISLLVAIGCGIAAAILGLLGGIPLIGPIISSIVPTAQSFVMVVFLLMVYRDKTGRMNSI